MVPVSFCLRSLPLWAVLLFVCMCLFVCFCFFFSCSNSIYKGFPGSSDGKESPCNSGDSVLIPGSGRISGEGLGYSLQYSWPSLVVQAVKNLPAMREIWVQSLGWEDPQEEGMATYSSSLAWRIPMDREAWQATSPWDYKESDTTEQLST